MGKSARIKTAARVKTAPVVTRPTRVTLRPVDFYRLSAAVKGFEFARSQAIERARQQIPAILNDLVMKDIAPVQQSVQALLTALGKTYHFAPEADYRLDEATYTLVPVEPTP